ncbi:MAG: tRNA pseudouridine(13) synthase TruD [Pseudohongiellaceae bacterium]
MTEPWCEPGTWQYAYGRPGIVAEIKRKPADFVVDELLGFKLAGSGEHICLHLRKTGVTTRRVVSALSRYYSVRAGDIGYAGMKDRQGICSQWFSVYHPGTDAPDAAAWRETGVELLDVRRNDRKLRLGSHQGNQFRLRLRNLQGDRREVERRLKKVAEQGVPNYFGEQRFGRNLSNLDAVSELFSRMQAGGGTRPARRAAANRGILLSAARSYLFNLVLSARTARGIWDAYLEGDIMNLAGTRRVFEVQAWDEVLQNRLQSFDIHPTGSLYGVSAGNKAYAPSGECAALESAVMAAYPLLCRGLEALKVEASRRSLRLLPQALAWEWHKTDDLVLEFELPPGGYATAVLREICVNRTNDEQAQSGGDKPDPLNREEGVN